MEFNRFNKDTIRKGKESQLLLDNPVFFEAVERVLNKYATLEENVLTNDQNDIRELSAKSLHYARMRRALVDAVNELDAMAIDGHNASN